MDIENMMFCLGENMIKREIWIFTVIDFLDYKWIKNYIDIVHFLVIHVVINILLKTMDKFKENNGILVYFWNNDSCLITK